MSNLKQMTARPQQGNYMIASTNCPPQTGFGQVICEQPNFYDLYPRTIGDVYTQIPQSILQNSTPSELHNLLTTDRLIIKRQLGSFEAITGFETNKKYTIYNNVGRTIYYAVEENKCCAQTYCGVLHGFEIKIMDQYGNEVIHLSKPYTCQFCIFPCDSEKIDVFSPVGCFVGSVEKRWSIFGLILTIRNELNDEVLKIKKSFCMCGEFKVFSKENVEVGHGSKQFSGLPKEFFPSVLGDSPYFGITFQKKLNVSVKAVVLSACFLILN